MKEEKEILKGKVGMSRVWENGNGLCDRLVDGWSEMYGGGKVEDKGGIRIEVRVVNEEDICELKE